MLQLVQYPGLPPIPRLYFDATTGRAQVSARHPTWQSHEWAMYTTEGLIIVVTAVFAIFLWHAIPYLGELMFHIMFCWIAVSVAYGVSAFFLRSPLREFFARQVFATRTKFWFTPEAIVFRSRLYARPVVIWRSFNSQPIHVRFVAYPDLEAATNSEDQTINTRFSQAYRQQSQILGIVVRSVDQHVGFEHLAEDGALRSIPVTELGHEMSIRLPLVCATAAMLTKGTVESASVHPHGIDIDTA